MIVRPAEFPDLDDWAAMRAALWPDSTVADHRAEVAAALATPTDEAVALIACAPDGTAVGVAEATVRHDYVNGCDTSPVAFLEGIYVLPAQRSRGIGRALVDAVAAWGAARGCAELASDAALDDHASHAFHAAVGLVETERVVCFRRVLAPVEPRG